ncbi:hypothetical protein [Belnapia moabensis]|uniref:hypothetical protein n=1 Tax=Belnapia moabensis TaxID=365533 RepID=UPI0005B9D317|nr:hypothetical protein [Belnapia moabensis]
MISSPYTVVLWDDDCEQHIVQVRAVNPNMAAIMARITQAQLQNRPLVEVDAVCVVPGHGPVYGDDELQDANWYCEPGTDDDDDDDDFDGEDA